MNRDTLGDIIRHGLSVRQIPLEVGRMVRPALVLPAAKILGAAS